MKYLGLIILIFISLTSCKDEKSYESYLNLSEKKRKILDISNNYGFEEQKLIGSYFETLKEIAFQIKYSKKVQKYINKKFNKYFNSKDCDEIFFGKKEYLSILDKCNVNGFYLCTEEAKYYVKILKEVKQVLKTDKVNKILSDNNCASKMKDLGV
jgi:hypothetical protein